MAGKKTKRLSLSKKIRFEVLKRDSFTCQYCGEKAPDVLLHIDHVKPISKGGTNDLMNLITACSECNAGKSNRELSDKTIIEKKRKQLDDLQERKEQIEMLIEWQEQLSELDQDTAERVAIFWSKFVKPYKLTESGKKNLEKLIHKFGESEVMEAMRISVRQYLEYNRKSEPTEKSVSLAWSKINGICRNRRTERGKPYFGRLLYIRGILKNRLNYVDYPWALQLLDKCVELGIDIDWLEDHAKQSDTWNTWHEDIQSIISEKQSEMKTKPNNKSKSRKGV